MYYGYVYLTENLINGKCYIGQHKSEKFDESYIGSGTTLVKAINKYGKENFVSTIIEWCNSREELDSKEIYWIAKTDASNDPNFYNITRGGGGHTSAPWNKGKHGVQERTPAMSATLEYGRHLPASEKLKDKLRHRQELVEYTQEYRQKLSEANSKWFKEHPSCYLYSPEGKRTRIEISQKHEYLAKGYLPYKEYKLNLESSTTIESIG